MFIGLELILHHLHLTSDSKEASRDDGLTRSLHSVSMLDLLIGNLGELGDGALEVDGLCLDFAVKDHCM